MNERIKQLALQASITFTDYGSGEFLTEDDISLPRLEKFAELIIQECLDAIVATKERPANNDLLFYEGLFTAIDGIKKRFGVDMEFK